MLKYAKIINQKTKKCLVGIGKNTAFYESIGMQQMEVEQDYNGDWYVLGFAPMKPELTYIEKRQSEYPSIPDQLDMLYWDKVNNTNLWQEKIAEIKT